MKLLIANLARSLVDRPDEVEVTEVEGTSTTILELKVAKEDIGKVIGKRGRTAGALRTILGAVSAKHKKRVMLEIVEDFQEAKQDPKLRQVRTLYRN